MTLRDTWPKIGPRETVYKNPYQRIQRVEVDFGRFVKEYFVNETGTRAGVLAIRNGLVLLVQQYRLLIDRLSLEIPGGMVDPGETPAAAAIRECLEETGVECFNLRPLVFYYPGLDTLDNPTHLFYSEKVADVADEGRIHRDEVVGYAWHPLDRCIEMIFSGRIMDSFTIAALLAYRTLLAPGHAK